VSAVQGAAKLFIALGPAVEISQQLFSKQSLNLF
jgi:hypothetical protein